MDGHEELEQRLAQRLRPVHVPTAETTWRAVQARLHGDRERGTGHPAPRLMMRVGLALLTALMITTTVVLAGSPAAREQVRAIAGVVGIGGTGSRVTALQPTPPFAVLQPSYLPPGMQLVAQSYNPGPTADGRPSVSATGAMSRGGGNDVDPAIVTAAAQRAQELLGDGREAMVVLIYAAGPEQFVEVVERSASGRALPAGDPVRLRNTQGAFTQRDGRDVLSWIEGDVFVEVYTTMGRAEALRVATGLQQTTLTAVEAPHDEPTPLPPAWVNYPLARRQGPIVAPQAGREAIDRVCGAWDPSLYATAPSKSYQQAICAARLLAGVGEGSNAGLSRHEWHQAAERLGLDPAGGPAGNPTVWMATLDVSDSGGSVVVLDVETGEPYVVMRLRPIP